MRKLVIAYIISWIIFALFLVGIGLSVKYLYYEKIPSYETETCQITNCSVMFSHSDFDVTLTLILEDVSVTKKYKYPDDPGYCNLKLITCYYDPSNIDGTLSVKKPSKPSLAVTILLSIYGTIWLAVLLGCTVGVILQRYPE